MGVAAYKTSGIVNANQTVGGVLVPAVYCSLPSYTAIAAMTNEADYIG